MSLINEALKKAQKEHSGQRQPPSFGGGGHHMHLGGHSGGSGVHLIKWIVIGVVLLGLMGWGVLATVMYFNKKGPVVEDVPVVVQDAPVKEVPISEPVIAQPVAPVQVAPEPVTVQAVEPTRVVPVAVVETPKPVVTQAAVVRPSVPESAPVVAQTPVQVDQPVSRPEPVVAPPPQPVQQPVSQPEPAPAVASSVPQRSPSLDLSIQYKPQVEEPQPKPEIVKAVYQLSIAAVMGRGGSTRIMVDGRVFRSGEIVDYDLMYKFVGKKGDLLYFIDQDGVTYEKRL